MKCTHVLWHVVMHSDSALACSYKLLLPQAFSFVYHNRLYNSTCLQGVSAMSSAVQLLQGPLRQKQAPPPAAPARQAQQANPVQQPPISATDAEVRLAQQMPCDCFEALLHLAATPAG